MFKNTLNTQSTTKTQEQWFSSVFTICLLDFILIVRQPLVGQGLLNVEASQ